MELGAFVLAGQFPGQTHHHALDRATRTATAAEDAGLAQVWVAEHHFVPYGTCPSAVTLAGFLLGRTHRIRLGTAVAVLPSLHPVAVAEQAALLHLVGGGRFDLGVGRGGPWVDLEVFGGGTAAFESGFPEELALLLRALRGPTVSSAGPRYRFREVPVVPHTGPQGTPPVLVACTSPGTAALAARQGLPMILGMHCGDEEKAAMVEHYRRAALAAGRDRDQVDAVPHVSAGVAQLADTRREARDLLVKRMPDFFRQGLGAHVTVDGRHRPMRDADAYTELLCSLHPVGTPADAASSLEATAAATGITRFALLVEGSGEDAETLRTVRALGAEVAPRVGAVSSPAAPATG